MVAYFIIFCALGTTAESPNNEDASIFVASSSNDLVLSPADPIDGVVLIDKVDVVKKISDLHARLNDDGRRRRAGAAVPPTMRERDGRSKSSTNNAGAQIYVKDSNLIVNSPEGGAVLLDGVNVLAELARLEARVDELGLLARTTMTTHTHTTLTSTSTGTGTTATATSVTTTSATTITATTITSTTITTTITTATTTTTTTINSVYSCYDVLQENSNAKDGVYKIGVDSNWMDFSKTVNDEMGNVEVLCHFYDGRAFTLYEMLSSTINADGTQPYSLKDKVDRHPADDSSIGKLYRANPNQCARYEVKVINSIFKHSEGYVMTRFANNANEYHVTDIFGAPEDGKHILAKDHQCSDKAEFNLALAYRQGTKGANLGYCFKQGRNGETSDCVCGDSNALYPGSQQFNKCSGGHGNLRRYNGKRSRNLFCSSMMGKCMDKPPNGILGDSYGCNLNRDIGGHFHASYFWSGALGMPCTSVGTYHCYGSRWIA